MDDPDFNMDTCARKSKATVSLMNWVICIVDYAKKKGIQMGSAKKIPKSRGMTPDKNSSIKKTSQVSADRSR